MAAINGLSDYKPGDVIKASDLNEIISRINRALNFKASAPLEASSGPYGLHVRLAEELIKLEVCELTEDLTDCAGATANLVIYTEDEDVDCDDYSADDDQEITVYDPLGRTWEEGERLIVGFVSSLDQWIILEAPGRMIRFITSTAKTLGGDALGTEQKWNGSSYVSSGPTIGLVDSLNIFGPIASGASGFAYQFNDRDTVTISMVDYPAYEIVTMEGGSRFIECTTTEDMGDTTTDEATATTNDYYGFPFNGVTPDLTTGGITIHDTQSLFSRSLSGAKALVVYDERDDEFNIIRCEVETTMYRGTANSAFDDGDSTVTVGNLIPLLAYPFSQETTDSTVTAHNVFNASGDSSGVVVIVWNQEDEQWEILQAECPS